MCAIFGALIYNSYSKDSAIKSEAILAHIMRASRARGRDGAGWNMMYNTSSGRGEAGVGTDTLFGTRESKSVPRQGIGAVDVPTFAGSNKCISIFNIVGNMRAEPTTEFIRNKSASDQQPYSDGGWNIVHNGTIANDKQFRNYNVKTGIDSAVIVEKLADDHKSWIDSLESEPLTNNPTYSTFTHVIGELIGSYAILANYEELPNQIMVGVNYRPVWYAATEFGVFFASAKEFFPQRLGITPVAIEPYSTALFTYTEGELSHDEGVLNIEFNTLRPPMREHPRALVIASGGLDSTVAASQCIKEGYDTELLHFQYGCRAENHEAAAINAIAETLQIPVKHFPLNIYSKKDSRLFDNDSTIAGGEAGAEYAHEWVPARNLVMLSIATAYAEANGFDFIVLGNNLEEAGAYPDNEPEFVRRFNELLPFAVGDKKQVEVLMPVGNMMKHEIVALGRSNGAPLELTWSCYKNGDKHCGKCGPCFMRKTAFEINRLEEVITYEN